MADVHLTTTDAGTTFIDNNEEVIIPVDLLGDPSYLGETFNISIAVVTFLLCTVASVFNFGIMTFYWPKVKTLIGFIYFMLSSSDFATGICAGLHTLIFITMMGLKQSDDQSTSYIFILIAPSYFLSVVSFKVSAYVSMVFAVIRTIRIISPISSVVNKTAVVISVFVWLAIWVAIFLVETGVFIKNSKESEDAAEMKKNALIGHFYQPNKAKYIQDLFGSNNDGHATSQGEMSKHGGVSAECAIDLLYTALPVFICAGITVIATIIQVIALLTRQSRSSDQEADRRSKTKLSITVILIGMVFIICSSCTLYQPFTVCFSDDRGAGEDRRRLYIMGYMPFFFNAAVNPIILLARVSSLKAHMLAVMCKGSREETSSDNTATTASRNVMMMRSPVTKRPSPLPPLREAALRGEGQSTFECETILKTQLKY